MEPIRGGGSSCHLSRQRLASSFSLSQPEHTQACVCVSKRGKERDTNTESKTCVRKNSLLVVSPRSPHYFEAKMQNLFESAITATDDTVKLYNSGFIKSYIFYSDSINSIYRMSYDCSLSAAHINMVCIWIYLGSSNSTDASPETQWDFFGSIYIKNRIKGFTFLPVNVARLTPVKMSCQTRLLFFQVIFGVDFLSVCFSLSQCAAVQPR